MMMMKITPGLLLLQVLLNQQENFGYQQEHHSHVLTNVLKHMDLFHVLLDRVYIGVNIREKDSYY
jgi:hypothetical protein